MATLVDNNKFYRVSLTKLVTATILLCAVALLPAAYVAPHVSSDLFLCIAAALINLAIMIMMTVFCNKAVKPLVLLLVMLTLLFATLRYIYLIAWPEDFNFNYLIHLNYQILSTTILFISLCLLVTFLGIQAGAHLMKTEPREVKADKDPLGFLGGSRFFSRDSIIYLSISFILRIYMSMYEYGRFTAIVTKVFFAYDAMLLIILCYLVVNWSDCKWKEKICLVFFFTFYVFHRTYLGSKAGIFDLGLFYMIALLVAPAERRFNLFLLLLLPVAFFLFPFGSIIRPLLLYYHGTGFSSLPLLITDATDIYSEFQWLPDITEKISARLGLLDYLVVMFNLKIAYPQYLDWSNVTASVLNTILPGIPFAESNYSAYLFKAAYGYKYLQEAIFSQHTDMLPSFGHYFIIFGPYLFLPALLLSGFLFSVLYIRASRSTNNYIVKAIILYFLYNWSYAMGLDTLILKILQLMFVFIGFYLFRVFLKQFDLFNKKPEPSTNFS